VIIAGPVRGRTPGTSGAVDTGVTGAWLISVTGMLRFLATIPSGDSTRATQ
jgi:hypothetical protein